MPRTFILFITFACLVSCHRKHSAEKDFSRSLFRAEDHTGENLFSGNIEGPAVDRQGLLYVVNYDRDGTIGLVHPDGKVELFVELPNKSIGNAIQFNPEGNMYVADFVGHNILEVNSVTREVSVYCHDERFNQPNDITITRKGVLFASDPNWQKQSGQLWRIGTDKQAVLLKSDMGTTNGICLSPDEKTLYVNESVQRKIWAFNVDEEGNISEQRLFATVPDYGLDGMKCDSKGNLYVTRYGKGTVAIYNTEGRQIQEVTLRGKNVSNITFGGKDNRTAFVTLQDRKSIERFRVDIPGQLYKFRM